MKKFCTSLRKQAKDMIDFETKNMSSLTKEELKPHQDAKVYYICGKRILKKLSQTINYQKVRDHCHCTGNIEVQHILLVIYVPNEVPVVFHNSSNYDYHFLIKELANEFEGKFDCLGENTKSTKSFSFQQKKK